MENILFLDCERIVTVCKRIVLPPLGERDAGEDVVEALNHTESTLALVGY